MTDMAMHFQARNAPAPAETPAERAARVQAESAAITRARAEIAHGEGIEDAALEAWPDLLDSNPARQQ